MHKAPYIIVDSWLSRMQAVENYAVGEHSVGESPATTSSVRIPEGPAVFSAPSKPNNPKKFRDSKPKTQKQCIKCDSPAVVHSFCADWCDECWNAPIGEQPTTVRLSSGSIVHRAPTPVATKTKIKIIKKKQEQFLETFAGILQQHGMCVGCGNVECCKCN